MMEITMNDSNTVNKITVSGTGTGSTAGMLSGSITYSRKAEPPVEISTRYYKPNYCLLAKTGSRLLRDNWASVMPERGFRVYTWDEADDLSLANFRSVGTEKFLCPSFIRDVKFSHSERTGKTSTVMFFEDGSKAVATPSDGETFDPVTGIEQCILKRIFGNRSQLKKVFKKYIPGYKEREKAARVKASDSETDKAWDELVKSSDKGTDRIKKNMDGLWLKEEEGRPWD